MLCTCNLPTTKFYQKLFADDMPCSGPSHFPKKRPTQTNYFIEEHWLCWLPKRGILKLFLTLVRYSFWILFNSQWAFQSSFVSLFFCDMNCMFDAVDLLSPSQSAYMHYLSKIFSIKLIIIVCTDSIKYHITDGKTTFVDYYLIQFSIAENNQHTQIYLHIWKIEKKLKYINNNNKTANFNGVRYLGEHMVGRAYVQLGTFRVKQLGNGQWRKRVLILRYWSYTANTKSNILSAPMVSINVRKKKFISVVSHDS